MNQTVAQTGKAVVVVPYNPEWPRHFIELKNQIWPHVEELAAAIEHVGSTSIDGLSAKPVIDIDIVIPDMSHLERTVVALAKIGYVHRGNLGIVDREAFRNADHPIKHNLYVCPKESISLRNHLSLRDALRANRELRDQYGALKLELAKRFPNSIDDYIEGKTEFILGILAASGLCSDRLAEIRKANQAKSC